MARYNRKTTVTHYRRVKGRYKKVKKDVSVEKGRNPQSPSDNSVIMSEHDPNVRKDMFIAKEKGKTRRSLYRNLTTQAATVGGQASSGAVAAQALSQNIAGGAQQAQSGRNEDNEPDEEEEPGPGKPPIVRSRW